VKKRLLVNVKNQNKVAAILLPKPTFLIWVVIIHTIVPMEVLVVVLVVIPDATQRVLP